MGSLFSPLQIKNLLLRNRLVMPPMALDIATEHGVVTDQLIQHYLLRARAIPQGKCDRQAGMPCAGVGLVIIEHCYVTPWGRAHPRQLGMYDDVLIPGLKLLVQELHKEGVCVGVQISHAGARSPFSPVGPTRMDCPYLTRFGQNQTEKRDLPHGLTKREIRRLTDQFAQAALRAYRAGFDLVEIHGAHGYLLNQFYSPLTNQREDEYGGSLENRLRFSLEVMKAVRDAVGTETPVFYRLGADDRLPGGNRIEDSIQAVPPLVEAGVDCLDLSGGICGYLKSGPEGFFTYLAEAIKPVSRVPVLVTGGIRSVHTANRLIEENKADLVGVGRPLLDDPDWARKAWMELNRRPG